MVLTESRDVMAGGREVGEWLGEEVGVQDTRDWKVKKLS